MACAQNRIEIVEILLARGAKAQYGETDEQPLAATTDSRIIELLIRAGANINASSGSSGNTALHQCASKGAVLAMRYLLDHGANVYAVNSFGATALHLACRTPSLLLQDGGARRAKETIRALIAAGAPVNVVDARGNTPLHFAARNAYLDAEDIRLLIKAGARLDAKDGLGRTPLAAAQAFGTDRLPGRLAVLRSSPFNQPK
jgi:ankyrin repeat protein